jgi:hypothetical protein
MAPLTYRSFSFMDLHEGHAGLQPGEVAFPLLIRKMALSHLHPLVLVDEDCDVLDVGPVGLVPAQDE